jgi:hypothetical protein
MIIPLLHKRRIRHSWRDVGIFSASFLASSVLGITFICHPPNWPVAAAIPASEPVLFDGIRWYDPVPWNGQPSEEVIKSLFQPAQP